jgi:bifunctional ADP-heptose synthase (sugar kinase/adenylyltransferase)
LGESCEDVYHYGIASRISPEGPVPIFIPTRSQVKEGMALNVKNNLEALSQDVVFVTSKDKDPIRKERYVDERFHAHILRIDSNDYSAPLRASDLDQVTNDVFDAIVVSDVLVKGFVTEVFDVCGAGDVFLAAMTCGFLKTGDLKKSLLFANYVASISVRFFGNGVISENHVKEEMSRL